MMKSALIVGVLVFAALSSQSALADFSKDTAQVSRSAIVSAVKDGNNAVVTWTDPLKVTRVQHYIGHGKKGGFIKDIAVGSEKKVILGDVQKNGARFNVVTDSGKFLHLECGGNAETTMPTFKGIVDRITPQERPDRGCSRRRIDEVFKHKPQFRTFEWLAF
jgi:hypothetical protein